MNKTRRVLTIIYRHNTRMCAELKSLTKVSFSKHQYYFTSICEYVYCLVNLLYLYTRVMQNKKERKLDCGFAKKQNTSNKTQR